MGILELPLLPLALSVILAHPQLLGPPNDKNLHNSWNMELLKTYLLDFSMPIRPGTGAGCVAGGGGSCHTGDPPDHDLVPQHRGVPLPCLVRQEAWPPHQVELQDVQQDTPGHGTQVVTDHHLANFQQKISEFLWFTSLYLLPYNLKSTQNYLLYSLSPPYLYTCSCLPKS